MITECCKYLPELSTKTICIYLVGYFFSIFFGLFFVKLIVGKFWEKNDLKKKTARSFQISTMGCIDKFIYTTSLLIGYPQFIAVWLAYRVAGRWHISVKEKILMSSVGYNIHMIGTGLSLIYGVTGGLMVKWLICDITKAIIFPLFLVLCSYFLYKLVGYFEKDTNKIEKWN